MPDSHNYYNQSRPEVAKLIPITDSWPLRVLDVGCGEGNFRDNFPINLEYWGVEMSHSAAEKAELKLDKVFIGRYEDVHASLPDAYFDCVVLADVMEHMPDPSAFLHLIKGKMRSDAVIVGSVPNVRYIRNLFELLWKKDWRYVDSGVLDRTHLRFFTYKSLLRELRETGYDIEEIQGINKIGANLTGIARGVKFLLSCTLFPLLGSDSKFMQFAFRAKPILNTCT